MTRRAPRAPAFSGNARRGVRPCDPHRVRLVVLRQAPRALRIAALIAADLLLLYFHCTAAYFSENCSLGIFILRRRRSARHARNDHVLQASLPCTVIDCLRRPNV